jgi:nicotinamide-nucleotide amidase
MAIEDEVVALCRERSATIALAESCTGGRVGSMLVSVPGSSRVFLGAVVAYANVPKQHLLGVPGELIARHGAVSGEVAVAMAEGARRLFGSTIALGITGIAGPTGGTKDRPAGTVFIALATPEETRAQRFFFPGPRRGYLAAVTDAALELVAAWLRNRLSSSAQESV